MKTELWKRIPGVLEYEISTFGRVRSSRGLRKVSKHSNDYLTIKLSSNGIDLNFTIHRLVAETFIPNPLNKPNINHIDGNKTNPHVDNLEWVTRSENQKHAYRTGLLKIDTKSIQPKAAAASRKKVYHYSKDGVLIDTFESVKAASLVYFKWNMAYYCQTSKITRLGIFSYTPLN